MAKTIVVTLKEPINPGKGTCAPLTNVIECDYVFADQSTASGLIECRTNGNPALYIPIHNILGMTYKSDSAEPAPKSDFIEFPNYR